MTIVSDPIGDLLTRMRNAQHARKSTCRAPWSRIKQELLELLKREGFVSDVRVVGDAPKQDVEVTFDAAKSKLELCRVSTPGRRVYVSAAEMKPVLQGFGIAVITTSKGLLTDKQARAQKVGGEVLCTVS
jgi:small subunit ribosomal protein S8